LASITDSGFRLRPEGILAFRHGERCPPSRYCARNQHT